ncbi:FAD-dependent oxidoreductase [Egibacter rhizosphaerae]|uniref:FAD-dependent oxidoreductase n=1 Tax=Egibacter rhizosphaerae TaxID=1670831 RepID=A0A411YEK1_9ACTN|nr:FAD-dependent oxidoreductase [Egibacter rhizosphaerae]QBI19683.1 FAD-dependent oxidoreductase [Egibacter rhizosphaerae]
MSGAGPAHRWPQPQHVGVIGAGVVGLSTAWFLQEQGLRVSVLERRSVAAGPSWGNAGLLTPSFSTPLPEPGILRYGARAVLDPSSPVSIPITADPRLWRFLAAFARHTSPRRWRLGVRALVPLNRQALAAFDRLATGGVRVGAREAEPFLACFRDLEEREEVLAKFAREQALGQEIDFELLEGHEARALEPMLSDEVGAAIRLHRQLQIDTPEFVHALADAVTARGGELCEGVDVTGIRHRGRTSLDVTTHRGETQPFDAVVLAGGVGSTDLARPFGVRQPIQAGRGYSFSVPAERPPSGPIHLPTQRVVCTPMRDRLRVSGMMEFRRPDAPLDHRRVNAIADAARPMLTGLDLDARSDEWVGARPVTPDGLPLIGPTRSPRVLVAAGHGMWGLLLGPVTGQLVAESIATGIAPPELTPFDPLR